MTTLSVLAASQSSQKLGDSLVEVATVRQLLNDRAVEVTVYSCQGYELHHTRLQDSEGKPSSLWTITAPAGKPTLTLSQEDDYFPRVQGDFFSPLALTTAEGEPALKLLAATERWMQAALLRDSMAA